MEKVDKQEEGAAVVLYGVDTFDRKNINGSIIEHKFSAGEDCAGWFPTKDEAWADYYRCKQLADMKLAEIEQQLADLRENLEFDLRLQYYDLSRNHGSHRDAVQVEISIGRYLFYREIRVD